MTELESELGQLQQEEQQLMTDLEQLKLEHCQVGEGVSENLKFLPDFQSLGRLTKKSRSKLNNGRNLKGRKNRYVLFEKEKDKIRQ